VSSVVDLSEQRLRESIREEMDRSPLSVRVRQGQGRDAALEAADAALDARVSTLEAAPEAVRLVGGVGQPAFEGAWANYGSTFATAGFYRDRGRVFLRGLVALGAAGTTIFTLPEGYRPPSDLLFVVTANQAFGEVRVNASGTVVFRAGSNVYVDLSAISFRRA
jgi:hypothetical protein